MSEHVCTLKREDTLRIVGTRKKQYKGKTLTAKFGIPRVGRVVQSEEQSYHYPADQWDAVEARLHCMNQQGIQFEEAPNELVMTAAERLKGAIR